jgi:hypothetical protein
LRTNPVGLAIDGSRNLPNSNCSTCQVERLCVRIRVYVQFLDACSSQVSKASMQQRPANALSHDIRVNPKMLQFDGGCVRIQLAEPEQPFTILRHESGSLGDRYDAWTEALPPRV